MLTGFNTAFAFNFANSQKGNLQELADLMPHGGVLRFPGGTLSNYYDCSMPGYGNKVGNQYSYTVHSDNYIWDFIELCKLTNSKPIVVLNLYRHIQNGNLTGWENTILPLITIMAHLEIAGVELGNEMYLHVFSDPVNNRNVNKFKSRVLTFIDIAKFFNAKCKELGLKTGVPTESMKSLRGKTWNQMMLSIGTNAICPHIYANSPADADSILDAKLNWKHNKEVWITESGFNFSFDPYQNLERKGSEIEKSTLNYLPVTCEKRKVTTLLRHSLCQDITCPYSYVASDKGKLVRQY